jgi:hypothetical protein
MSSVYGNGNSSLGHALFKSLKSTQNRICPFFILIGTIFVIHFGNCTSRMNPSCSSLLTSASIWGRSSSQNNVEQSDALLALSPIDELRLLGLNLAFPYTSMQRRLCTLLKVQGILFPLQKLGVRLRRSSEAHR